LFDKEKRLQKETQPKGFALWTPREPARANIRLRLFAGIADEKGNDWQGPGRKSGQSAPISMQKNGNL
jgi:hypothetical protein